MIVAAAVLLVAILLVTKNGTDQAGDDAPGGAPERHRSQSEVDGRIAGAPGLPLEPSSESSVGAAGRSEESGPTAAIVVEVRAAGQPVERANVLAIGATYEQGVTRADGRVAFRLDPGEWEFVVPADGAGRGNTTLYPPEGRSSAVIEVPRAGELVVALEVLPGAGVILRSPDPRTKLMVELFRRDAARWEPVKLKWSPGGVHAEAHGLEAGHYLARPPQLAACGYPPIEFDLESGETREITVDAPSPVPCRFEFVAVDSAGDAITFEERCAPVIHYGIEPLGPEWEPSDSVERTAGYSTDAGRVTAGNPVERRLQPGRYLVSATLVEMSFTVVNFLPFATVRRQVVVTEEGGLTPDRIDVPLDLEGELSMTRVELQFSGDELERRSGLYVELIGDGGEELGRRLFFGGGAPVGVLVDLAGRDDLTLELVRRTPGEREVLSSITPRAELQVWRVIL